MDTYSKKKVGGGMHFSRNGLGTAFLDNHEDRTIRFRNHQGCSTRATSPVGNLERPKPLRLAFFSTGRKATVGDPSGAISRIGNKWKPQQEREDTTFLQERGTMSNISREVQIEDFESNNRHKANVNLKLDPTSEGIDRVSTVGEVRQSSVPGFSLNVNETAGNHPVASSTRSRRPRYQVAGCSNQESSSSLPARYSVLPRSVNHNFRHSQNQIPSSRRYGLGNLSCTSISDVLPSGCSPDVDSSRGADALRKIYTEGGSSSRSKGTVRASTGRSPDSGESSSARSKGTIRSLTGVDLDSHRTSPSSASSSILEHALPQPTSRLTRRTRSQLTSRDGGVLVRNQRAASGDDDTILLPETIGVPPSFLAQLSLNDAAATSSRFSTSLPSIAQAASGRLGFANGSSHTRRRVESEDNNIRGFHGPWMHRDGYPRFNMEGIAEVFLALERIEQDEVLTYEELMVLESNFFFNGVSFRDQHRDMRMDIDNMSYEELLALEEKMGTVSTALTEEALSRCLKRIVYAPVLTRGIRNGDADVKCSICQEEYNVGEEVGKLQCDHRYHVTCIEQWLRQKNWCPICKSAACSS